jgi:hypothetical protein
MALTVKELENANPVSKNVDPDSSGALYECIGLP